MRFQILSDLHLEAFRADQLAAARPPAAAGAEALVLAGDIANGTLAFEAWRDWPVPVLYVPGNHEYFDRDFDHARCALHARAAQGGAVELLDPGERVLQGRDGRPVRVLGVTLWTDFALYEPQLPRGAAMAAARERMSDYRAIRREAAGAGRLEPGDTLARHLEERAWLQARLATPFDGPTVVVTHHGPTRRSIHPRYGADPVNACFASALDEVAARSTLWIHGHTHSSLAYRVGAGRVVANPRGYPLRGSPSPGFQNPDFDPQLMIDV